jgi:hypothetical protein
VDETTEYSYRRTLGVRELIPALGVGIAAGLAAFYLAKLAMEKTPLRVEGGHEGRAPRRVVSSR